ncbi:MAG: thermonuclease family protein [Alphaproteobacteria bacterium]|nr:thermonuclease family protein [Alphaproteobacteria bacterium]
MEWAVSGTGRRWAAEALVALALAFWAVVAGAQPLEDGGRHRVVEVIDGDTVVLDDGRQVRFVGIQAPKLPLGRKGFEEWPLAQESKDHLARLALDRMVALRYGGARKDRHGRRLAHLYLEDGTWVQGDLLSAGLARVYTWPDNRAMARALLDAERSARQAGRGIWSHPFYRILKAEEAGGHIDSFQLVEGVVQHAAAARGRVFLNFGADWRTDFTVEIEAADMKTFRDSGLDPKALEGRRVRVRGWIKSRNGPAIQATHPEQIEILPP